MTYNSLIMNLYFLLVYSDGEPNQKELAAVKLMIQAEGVGEDAFNLQMEFLKAKDQKQVYVECMTSLQHLGIKQQIRIVAWLCVIANADGFMDRNEWQFIYGIYHRELDLPLSEIFTVQKELNRLIWEKDLLTRTS